MPTLSHKAGRAAFSVAVDAVLKKTNKDRNKAFHSLVDLAERFMGDSMPLTSYDAARKVIDDPESKWMLYINRLLDEVSPNVLKTAALNFGYEAGLCGTKKVRKMREQAQCNIPWTILIDPTSACNLHCTGCWAAEYGHKLHLTYDELDSIITQGKKLGIYFYMYTGGEPLVRKADIIRLCEMHPDCAFLAFTNATLIDEAFAAEMLTTAFFRLKIHRREVLSKYMIYSESTVLI